MIKSKSILLKLLLTSSVISGVLIAISGIINSAILLRESYLTTENLNHERLKIKIRTTEQFTTRLAHSLELFFRVPWGKFGHDPKILRDDLIRFMNLEKDITEISYQVDNSTILTINNDGSSKNLFLLDAFPTVPGDVQAISTNNIDFSEFSVLNGVPTLRIAVTGKLDAHEIRIFCIVSLRRLFQTIEQQEKPRSSILIVFDNKNNVVYHDGLQQSGTTLHPHDQNTIELFSKAMNNQRVKATSAYTHNYLGNSAISFAGRSEQLGWIFCIQEPFDLLIAPIIRSALFSIITILAVIALSPVIFSIFNKRIMGPVNLLRDASARISRGNFKIPVKLQTGDELELLADDLNTMAQRLSSFYQELEAQVQQRTAELSEARDASERASQAKTRFLAAASHDLRQPMHTIGLLLGVLRTRLSAPEQLDLAERLAVSVDTMERLFSSLLDISKLDAGVIHPIIQNFPVQQLLDSLKDRFEIQAAEKGIELIMAPCRAWVKSDPGLLERCLGNLVSNALRYTKQGKVLVGCRYRQDGTLAFQVIDTGPGIPDHQLDVIFEEFVRLPSAEVASARGLGLGLAIVRRTAELLQHPVSVQSVLGKGSCFQLRAPRWNSAVLSLNQHATEARLQSADLAEMWSQLFVLVVDDDPDNRQALEALCIGWGSQVVSACSAASALETLQQHLRLPDLVLTDLRLGPGQDGLDLIVAIRRDAESAIPALLITAELDSVTNQRAQALGVPVLNKPASAERVAQAVSQLLNPI